MSGDHNTLISKALSLISDPSTRSAFAELTRIIVCNQYIQIPGDPEHAFFRVLLGTGMGMILSGDLSDSAFLAMCETPTVLRQSFIDHFHVKTWLRFKDDVFCVLGGGPALPFIQTFRHFSRFFIIKVDEIRNIQRLADEGSWVSFLDVEITPVPCNSGGFHFAYRPYRKPSTLWRPLSHSSFHATSIHHSWPRSYAQRLVRHASSKYDQREAIDEFRLRMRIYLQVTRVPKSTSTPWIPAKL